MPVTRRTVRAEEDLIEIWLHIAQDNPSAADTLLDALEQKFILLAQHPQIGAARPEIASELRHFPNDNYLILYRIIPKGVEIVRVVHGARLLDDLLL